MSKAALRKVQSLDCVSQKYITLNSKAGLQ